MDPRLQRNADDFLEAREKPSPEELARYYADQYYQQEQSGFRKSYPEIELKALRSRIAMRADHAISFLSDNSGTSLLDVGCGEGFVLAHFRALGWQTLGMDYSIDGVSRMNPDEVETVVAGDIYQHLDAARVAGQRFNIIWLGNVLEHVLDPHDLLRTVADLMEPKGVAVVTVPNDGSKYQQHLIDTGKVDHAYWVALPDHLSYFTYESLLKIAAQTGWFARDVLADFPIDLFLSHPGSNYVRDRVNGPAAHQARLELELLIAERGQEATTRFYSAMARVGLGRDLTAFLQLTGTN